MTRLRDEVESLFSRFANDPWGWGGLETGLTAWPRSFRADMAESDDEVIVTLELPGVDSKDLDINVSGQTLTVRGEKREDREEKERSYHYVERQFGSFHRSIPLPASVDADKVDASFKNGVLTIRLGKRPEARPKKIPVIT